MSEQEPDDFTMWWGDEMATIEDLFARSMLEPMARRFRLESANVGGVDDDNQLVVGLLADAYEAGKAAAAERDGEWVTFDMTDPNGPDIEDGTPAWVVWRGVVQHQPWIWDHSDVMGPAWLVTGGSCEPDRIVHGVSHYLPCKVPAAPQPKGTK